MDIEIFLACGKNLGLIFTEPQLTAFEKFSQLLIEGNKKANLTAITDPAGISVKHFADSLAIFSAFEIPQDARVIDVGTGAGFPGIPLKIFRPDLSLTLLDASQKKLNFLEAAVAELDLNNVKLIHARAEEFSRNPEFRDSFDVSVSRAVAPLPMLCEFCLPYVKVGGHFFAYKSRSAVEEVNSAQKIIKGLGGKLVEIREVKVSAEMTRNIVSIEKIAATPREFPRKFAKIKSANA
jgi:16S rRNA (guanine527-N7)-methyltransferase